ncbi:hypothetical protein Taro_015298 [Colocasia esculenta]|uniref:Uncharacterized protein n=1 Tax=Colocasia esculenta TaxID=4460 RepID=A0A843UKG5_COLES|nr:hypothetical protein [Colocasia esculenta]
MEHPAVSVDSKGTGGSSEESGFCILAISEIGFCYFWLMENRLATMQMATTARLILQTIKSTPFGFSILIFFIIYAIGEQSSSDVDGDDHETRFAED